MSGLLCLEETELAGEEIISQLERILADRRFTSSDRNASFLRYVVERALEGKAEEIKEMVIATDLYGRSSSYDPKIDSIVRVEATRLRSRLREYYEQEGRLDPIRITIPKGTYVPQFEKTVPETALLETVPAEEVVSSLQINAPVAPKVLRSSAWIVLLFFVVLAGGCLLLRQQNASGPHPDALAAWQEGNELLGQDPHSGVSERGAPQTLLRAIERYEFAVAKEPRFASGWASLSEAYDYAFPYVDRDSAEDARRAEAAARRAIELDKTLAAGHAMLALNLSTIRWNFPAAEAEYRRAIELDPRNYNAVIEYADLLRETGRIDEAAAEIHKARTLLPAIPVLAVKEAEIQLDQGRADAAIATATSAIQLNRELRRAYVALGAAWEAKGEHQRALTHYREALVMNGQDRRALPAYGYLLGIMGRREEAQSVAHQLEDINSRIRNCAFQVAVVYAGMGEHNRALNWLEQAWKTRQAYFPFAAIEYRLKPLHQYPRFHDLLSRIGLKAVSR